MALVHDMAEAILGDMTPECGIDKDDKHKIEHLAMQEMCSLLKHNSQYIMELFEEYNQAQTKEAQLVKQVDKLEFLLQASEYEQSQGINLEEFFKSTRHVIEDPALATLLARIDDERTMKGRVEKQD